MNDTRALWYVIQTEDGSGKITDDLSTLLFESGDVVYRGQTIRDCRMWLDRNGIEEATEEPIDTDNARLNETIRNLREVGFSEDQIVRVVVKEGLLRPEG